MIVNEETLLQLCKDNGVEAFEVLEGLDLDTDIILSTDDIEEVFRLCRCYNEKAVFYSYTVDTNENALAEKTIEQKISVLVEKKSFAYNTRSWLDREITSEDIDDAIERHAEDIKKIALMNTEEKQQINSITLDVFISHYGERMGVSIYVEAEENETDYNESSIDKLVDTIVEEIDILNRQRIDERNTEYERKRNEREKRYNEAITAIKAEISDNDKILECTNGKLRHAYARDLATKYSEQYDIGITIGEVDVIVDLEYKKRK